MLGCVIWLPMFCTVSMGDLWHSYVSTSVLPDYIHIKKLNIFGDGEWDEL